MRKQQYLSPALVTALLMLDYLLILWLVILPWREKNLAGCKIGTHKSGANVFKGPVRETLGLPHWVEKRLAKNPNETFWQFHFPGTVTKNHKDVSGILPRRLIKPLEEFLFVHRPVIVGDRQCDRLFVNWNGAPMAACSIINHVETITLRYIGRRINPHAFRNSFSVQWLIDHPKDYLTLAKILWHSDERTVVKIYGALYDESQAAKQVDEWSETRAQHYRCRRRAS